MDTNRRNFLIQTASAAGVIGLGYLLWDKPAEPKAPQATLPGDVGKPPRQKPAVDLMRAALQKMGAEDKPGVAVRIPSEAGKRHLPGHYLVRFINEKSIDTRELLAEAVFVCLESPVLQDQIEGADPAHAMVLFDYRRRAIAGIPLELDGDWNRYASEVTRLLHGELDQRLRARAESIRAKADETVLNSLARMAGDEDGNLILAQASTIAPLLVYERRGPGGAARKTLLGEILQTYLDEASDSVPGPRLPFGVKTGSGGGGCGECCEEIPIGRGAVECGMGRVNSKARQFVRYLKS